MLFQILSVIGLGTEGKQGLKITQIYSLTVVEAHFSLVQLLSHV